jgi:16S rRNA (guanine966-N2)-methyltransferase
MTRIVAGVARGRQLRVPPGRDTRPTSDRVREALFASLTADLGGFGGLAVADLYAGSGAVGLEALSRGARSVLLVESDRRAAGVIRQNIEAVGLPSAHLVTVRVERVAGAPPEDGPYDVVFLDPPYAVTDAALHDVLADLRTHGWLAPDAVVVVERATRGGDFAWPDGFEGDRTRAYGETALWYGRPL